MPNQFINRPLELIPFQYGLLTQAKLRASSTDASAVNSVERYDRRMDKFPGFCKQSRILGRILLPDTRDRSNIRGTFLR
jgi:hypothetical protein